MIPPYDTIFVIYKRNPKRTTIMIPKVRLVFDRKKIASKDKKGLVQIEVLYAGKRKWITTGIKVYKDQWHDRSGVVNSFDALRYNEELHKQCQVLETWLFDTFGLGKETFDWERLDRWLNTAHRGNSFIKFAYERIENRKDIRESTRKTQRKLIKSLMDFGRIECFGDLKKSNIIAYDKWLHEIYDKQSTISSYIKFLKIYVNEAMKMDLIKEDPFLGLKFKKGDPRYDKFLTEKEVEAVRTATLPSSSLQHVRDLFVIQCYTGLAFSDLMAFDFSKAIKRGDKYVLTGNRTKTNEGYYVVLLPVVMEILKKYDYKLPRFSNAQYNMRLKIVADAAGIEKPISSHWGRKTCGYMLLNNGFSIESVAKVLGHADIKTTQTTYAKILDETIDKSFEDLF